MLILGTGSNLGDSLKILSEAKTLLKHHFVFVAESRYYRSKPVGYEHGSDFYNQVLEFKSPSLAPEEILAITMNIEVLLGRKRIIPQGPRTLDIDLLFLGTKKYISPSLTIPHPRALQRSFVVHPLRELPCFGELQKTYSMPSQFEIEAYPLRS